MNNLPTLPPNDPGYLTMDPLESHAPPAKFNLPKFLSFLRKLWWVPLITLTLGLGGAIAYYFLAPPAFVSKASLTETEKLRLPGGAAFTDDPQNNAGTYSAQLRSDVMRSRAVRRLRLMGTNNVPSDAKGEPLEVELRVTPVPKSLVYYVEAGSANQAYTSAYLDALMEEFLEYKRNVRKVVSGGTLSSISDQALRVDQDLKADQNALAEFQKTNNLSVLEQEGNIAGSYLAKLKTQLSDYQLENRLLDATVIEQASSSPVLTNAADLGPHAPANDGNGNAPVAGKEGMSAYQELELLKLQRDQLSENLLPQHPKIIKLDEDIARSQKLIDIYRRQNADQTSAARQALKIKIASVEDSIKDWEKRLLAANTRIAAAEKLRQNVARDQGSYDRLSSVLQNVDMSRNIDQETLTVMEQASPAIRSYKAIQTAFGLAILGGLAAGFGIVFLVTVRDDRFDSLMDVTEQMGGNVVGQVPDMPQLKGGEPLALLEDNDDRHIYAESYRSLRSALLFLAVEGEPPKVLLITSAVPNEGKSTIATNLARALALGGSRVLLVDGDMRKGHLHELLGLAARPGLSEMLRQPGDPYQFIQTNSLANFSFIGRGNVQGNPGDLLLNSGLKDVLTRLRQDFDYILIDSSPVFAADDAATLAPKVDGTLFVVRSRFSRARAVREALDMLTQRQARVLGLVLNRADASAKSYYYYNYADYYPAAKTV